MRIWIVELIHQLENILIYQKKFARMKNYSIKIKKKFTIFSSLIRSHIISFHIKLTLAKDDSRKLRDRDGAVLIDIETKIK